MIRLDKLKSTIMALSVLFSLAVAQPVTAAQVGGHNQEVTSEQAYGLSKYETVINQIKSAIAEGDNGPEDIEQAFIYKATPESIGELVEFPGVLEAKDASYIYKARRNVLGDEFADAATDEQVQAIINDMHSSRGKHQETTKMLFLLLLSGATLAWMTSVGVKQLWEHEKNMRRERCRHQPQV